MRSYIMRFPRPIRTQGSIEANSSVSAPVGCEETATLRPAHWNNTTSQSATLLPSQLSQSQNKSSNIRSLLIRYIIPSQPLPKPHPQAPSPRIHQPLPILHHPVNPHLPSLRLLHPAPAQHHARDRHRSLVLDR